MAMATIALIGPILNVGLMVEKQQLKILLKKLLLFSSMVTVMLDSEEDQQMDMPHGKLVSDL